jgi:hypothetical protein
VREAAAKGVSEAFGSRIRLFSLITNTLVKDKEVMDKWRNHARPGSSRNLANMVEDEVVDALVAAVTDSFPRLSHRYYTLKAKWLGLEKLQHWDRNAPLPRDDDSKIAWPDAVEKPGAPRLCRLQPRDGEAGRALLRAGLDRCRPAPRQGERRLRPSDGAVRASLPAAELSRQGARRDDAGP